ncbi:hypothetical protein [Iningainema tapete]|uniref:Uncharacterized protein n=1 Tax=Iningainema tapete BLCC-T55 TaxID=2748662 RepID=A0A8J6XP87_9CYAN|nr:hypothetical protein [Iningainema tapete]MBD2775564.1 hypothetical protein [Iningainema tapete BLCC-T55]
MAWYSYGLDQEAQKLVLAAKQREKNSLNQSYKMRMAVAYGLERFWGEHLRLQKKEPNKSLYWKETWEVLVKIMQRAGVTLPNDNVNADDVKTVQAMSEKLWQMELSDQRVALAVLTSLCDSIVWWTQRHKG